MDDLIISGGSSTVVASDELLFHAQMLSQLSNEASSADWQLLAIDRLISERSLAITDAPMSAAQAEREIERARALLGEVENEASRLSRGLTMSAEYYGFGERFNERLGQELTSSFGYVTGSLWPLMLAYALPALSVITGGVLIGSLLAAQGQKRAQGASGKSLRKGTALLTNPQTVALTRAAVMSSDDFIGGALRLPYAAVSLLGDNGLGILGLNTSAALLTVLGGKAGMLTETPVHPVATGHQRIDRAPQGYAERIDRIPDPAERADGAQFRIERYSQDGEEDRFEVFIAGTVDFSLEATDEPWDMTSNVNGIAGLPAGSYQAVAEALAEAGVESASPIVFTGYSQGGLVATLLASSGDYNTQGLLTVGAPAGQVPLPEGFPAIAIEHTDDIVPATGGNQVNPHLVLVERELFGGRDVPQDQLFPAHQLDAYRETASLLDDARSDSVTEAIGILNSFGAGATEIVDTTYRATRTQAD